MTPPSLSGQSRYLCDYYSGPHRLLVAVACQLGDDPALAYALLDTASEWCVLPGARALELGVEVTPDPLAERLHTRLGWLEGRIERVPLTFVAEEGEAVRIDATCFVSEEWTGPVVLGWRGVLERMRFAVDPVAERFYFGEA